MKLLPLGILIAGMTLASATASAATITVSNIDQTRGQNIWLMADGVVEEGYAGAILLQIGSAAPSPVLCVDLFTNVNLGDSFDVSFILPQYLTPDAARGLRAAYLFVNFFGSVATAAQGAAMQLAIWDIIHDGGDGFSVGRIQASTTTGQATDTTIRDAALQYVAASLDYASGSTNATVFRHVQGPYAKQQLLGAYQPGTGAPPVPEPSTILMMGAGAGLLGWHQYHKRKR